jgi:NADH-quinone oxidoreductase subunit J
MVETLTFLVAAAIVLGGAVGVIVSRNPVHAALSLVATLFGIAVHFVAQEAHLLAAVQVIVYTGAIVVLILFVLMLLGIDRVEDLRTERLGGQRALGALLAVGLLAGAGVVAWRWAADGSDDQTNLLTGMRSATGRLDPDQADITQIGRTLFTDYVFAFELTAALLTIAVIGAVVLARRPDDPAELPAHPDAAGALRDGEPAEQLAPEEVTS